MKLLFEVTRISDGYLFTTYDEGDHEGTTTYARTAGDLLDDIGGYVTVMLDIPAYVDDSNEA